MGVLLWLIPGAATFGLGSAIAGDLGDDPDDGPGWFLQAAGFVLLFVVTWGTAAYFLARVGFFEQVGKALSSVVNALGIRDLFAFFRGLL